MVFYLTLRKLLRMEAVETIIEVKNNEKERFLNESADLLFHLLILLKAKGAKFDDVISVLKSRN